MNLIMHLMFLTILNLDGALLGGLLGNWIIGVVAANSVLVLVEFIYYLTKEAGEK